MKPDGLQHKIPGDIPWPILKSPFQKPIILNIDDFCPFRAGYGHYWTPDGAFFCACCALTNNSNMLSFLMRIVGRGLILEFIQRYPDSRSSLTAWKQVVEVNNFKHFNELKQTFGSADYVRPYTVFNIAGNKYRLISLINYQITVVAIENILTHSEYDKGKWRK